MGEKLFMDVHFNNFPGEAGDIALTIKNRFDQTVTSNGTYQLGNADARTANPGYHVLRFEMECAIEAGSYSFIVDFCEATAPNRGRVIDSSGWLGPIDVQWDYEHERAPFLGMFGLPVTVTLR